MLKRTLAKVLGRSHASAEENAYARLAKRGFEPRSVIDVGAYHGNWTRMIKATYPGARVLMCEAQPAKLPHLQRVCDDLSDVEVVAGLMAARAGEEVSFFEMETGSSMFPENSDVARHERTLTTRTLDDVGEPLGAPCLLKIDVQGAELEVLRGATQLLGKCEFVQLEIALLDYNRGAPTFLDVISFMDERGFVPFDIAGGSRPNGVDLVQIDLLFSPRSSDYRSTLFNFAEP